MTRSSKPANAAAAAHGRKDRRVSAAASDKVEGSSEEDDAQMPANTMPPQIPGNVIRKLLAFSLLLLALPILAYFASLKYVFVGATASSAIVAVVVANFVLAGYVYVAWIEEDAAATDTGRKKLKKR